MKLKLLWKRLVNGRDGRSQTLTEASDEGSSDSRQRALFWVGKDRLESQYFFEQWACRETWRIYDQGLPILLNKDPDHITVHADDEFFRQRQELWEHFQRCVQQGVSPFLVNPHESPENWQAKPAELYRWAIASRVDVPSELADLLSFINRSTKSLDDYRSSDSIDADNTSNFMLNAESMAREKVLSVMLSLSLQAQHEINAEPAHAIRQSILETLYAKSELYFDQQEPPLSRPVINDLIDRSLEMAGLIHMSG